MIKRFRETHMFWLGIVLLFLAFVTKSHDWLMGGMGQVMGYSVSNALAGALAIAGVIGSAWGKDPDQQAHAERVAQQQEEVA